eukprot:gene6204-7436_t
MELAEASGASVRFAAMRPALGEPPFAGRSAAEGILDDAEAAAEASGIHLALCVCGLSTNRAELELVAAAKDRSLPVALVIDFAPGHRLSGVSAIPDLAFATNPLAAAAVEAEGLQCFVAGSAYLEQLSNDAAPPAMDAPAVRSEYKLAADAVLVPLFLAPDDMVPDAPTATVACLTHVAEAFATLKGEAELALVIRPHPRWELPTRDAVRQAVPRLAVPAVLDESPSAIDNKSLYKASYATLTLGSTVSVESMAYGTRSAFVQIGWDPSKIEAIMYTLPVPRLTSCEALLGFLAESLTLKRSGETDCCGPFDVEGCCGAAHRTWERLKGLCPSGATAAVAVAKEYVARSNAHDLDGCARMMTEDVEAYGAQGLDAVRAIMADFYSAHSGLHYACSGFRALSSAKERTADAARFVFLRTWTQVDGQSFKRKGVETLYFRDGLVVRIEVALLPEFSPEMSLDS